MSVELRGITILTLKFKLNFNANDLKLHYCNQLVSDIIENKINYSENFFWQNYISLLIEEKSQVTKNSCQKWLIKAKIKSKWTNV